MAAEIVIGGLSLVSLITLFQTCDRAYDVFIRSAKNIGREAHIQGVLLSVERQKLRLWGYALGISHKQQCRLLRTESYSTQQTVVDLLECIRVILNDIDVITVRYGIKFDTNKESALENPQNLLEGLSIGDIQTCAALDAAKLKRIETERSIKASTSRLGKLRWALSDSNKLDKLIKELRLLNDNLWVALPRNQWLQLAKGLPSVVLPDISDQTELDEVQKSATEETMEVLNVCSDLRRAVLIADADETKPNFANHLEISCSVVGKVKAVGSGNISMLGHHITTIQQKNGTQTDVLLEWRYIDQGFTYDERQVMLSRIKALASFLNASPREVPGLLKCIAFFKDEDSSRLSDIQRYGILFEYPTDASFSDIPPSVVDQSAPQLLSDLVQSKKRPPPLGERFAIATSLCNTLLQIHSANWLHKSVRSSNVVFFPQGIQRRSGDLDFLHPFLMGFGISRPDRPAAPSLEVTQDRTGNDYKHPSLWSNDTLEPIKRVRYNKEHDIYALGVVLLEVGLWQSVGSYSNEYRDTRDPMKWTSYLLKRTRNYLESTCGTIYEEVVETCLNGRFSSLDSLSEIDAHGDNVERNQSFLFDVVYKLGQCRA